MLLRNFISPIVALAVCAISGCAIQADRFERITPAEAGYSPEKLDELAEYLESAGSSSLLLVHDGKVFFEWGDIYEKHLIHSMRKSLLNGLYGVLYDKGKLDLGATMASLGVQDAPARLNETELGATLDMVLKSRSGIYLPATGESEWMKSMKPGRGQYEPGVHYYYNNWDFNAAGALFEQLSGESIYDAFEREIARPLGMLHYGNVVTTIEEPHDGEIPDVDGMYQVERTASRFPAYHFRMSAHDLALYGQLFLNHGRWKGEQIISSEWIDRSTQPYSITSEQFGLAYGILWSVIMGIEDDAGRNSFYHAGAGVHMLGVYPKYRLVLVHRVDTEADETKFTADNLYPIISMIHGARVDLSLPHE